MSSVWNPGDRLKPATWRNPGDRLKLATAAVVTSTVAGFSRSRGYAP